MRFLLTVVAMDTPTYDRLPWLPLRHSATVSEAEAIELVFIKEAESAGAGILEIHQTTSLVIKGSGEIGSFFKISKKSLKSTKDSGFSSLLVSGILRLK